MLPVVHVQLSEKQIIDGVVVALGILEEKSKEIEKSVKLAKDPVYEGSQVNRREIAGRIG